MVYLLLLFTIVPLIELAIIIKVGAQLGALKTIVLLFVMGAAGAYLARMEGFRVLQRVQASLDEGMMPTEEMLDGFIILAGGILLLTPGFLTDVFGFLLVLPWSRSLIKILLRKKLNEMIKNRKVVSFRRFSSFD